MVAVSAIDPGTRAAMWAVFARYYADVTRPADRKVRGLIAAETARGLVDDLRPEGDVLELACGPGGFTRELARHARSLTAVDGSPRMLAHREGVLGAGGPGGLPPRPGVGRPRATGRRRPPPRGRPAARLVGATQHCQILPPSSSSRTSLVTKNTRMATEVGQFRRQRSA